MLGLFDSFRQQGCLLAEVRADSLDRVLVDCAICLGDGNLLHHIIDSLFHDLPFALKIFLVLLHFNQSHFCLSLVLLLLLKQVGCVVCLPFLELDHFTLVPLHQSLPAVHFPLNF